MLKSGAGFASVKIISKRPPLNQIVNEKSWNIPVKIGDKFQLKFWRIENIFFSRYLYNVQKNISTL